MHEKPGGEARSALGEALLLDPTLAAEPARLRRALADLAPHDERGGWLLALGAAVGMPDLIGQGQPAEAQARLADLLGCRPEAASWAASAWALALGHDLPDGPGRPSGMTLPGPGGEPPEATPVEEPGAPSALRVSVRPDGAPVIAVVTMRGAFVLADARIPARGRWRRAAMVRTPLSRDVALAVDSELAEVVWTDQDGVHARSLRRGGAGPLSLGEPRLVDSPPDGEQARYPLAAVGSGAGRLSVIWTADRRSLRLTEASTWMPRGEPVPLAAACADGERLTSLDACLETERTAWLACRTDRGRVLATRWDLAAARLGGWQPLDPPAVPVAAAIMCLDGIPLVVAATSGGALLSVDARGAARGAARWHTIDRPESIRRTAPTRIIAACGPGPGPGAETGWLALAGNSGVSVMPVARNGGIVECGDPAGIWMGG